MRFPEDDLGIILNVYDMARKMNRLIANGYSNDMIEWDEVNRMLALAGLKDECFVRKVGKQVVESFQDFKDLYDFIETICPLVAIERYQKAMEKSLSSITEQNELEYTEANAEDEWDILDDELDELDVDRLYPVEQGDQSVTLSEELDALEGLLEGDRTSITELASSPDEREELAGRLKDYVNTCLGRIKPKDRMTDQILAAKSPIPEEPDQILSTGCSPLSRRVKDWIHRLEFFANKKKLPDAKTLPMLPKGYQDLYVHSLRTAFKRRSDFKDKQFDVLSVLPVWMLKDHYTQLDKEHLKLIQLDYHRYLKDTDSIEFNGMLKRIFSSCGLE